jgi:two-component system cell cycle response regulator DivK
MTATGNKILVVDDNEDWRSLLALFVKRLGYEVVEATTGQEAIDRATAIHPDLILMDLGLPGMSGDKATGLLKAQFSTRDIPVVVQTAYTPGEYTG